MKRLFTLLPWALFMAGCCCHPATTVAPPPPITIEEQLSRLERWRQAMPRVRADLAVAGAHLEYLDENGKPQSNNAEGYLFLQQHFDAALGSPESRGDVYLAGKVFETTKVFEAGRNAQDWWFAIFLDRNTVRTGNASQPVSLASLSDPQSSGILRADLVFDMLGLSALPPAHNLIRQNGEVRYLTGIPGMDKVLLMRVDDVTGTNSLLVEEFTAGGALFLSREIIIDRTSGHVSEVRIYNPAGVLVVRSQLEAYAPVAFDDAAAKPAVAPQFPRLITLSYPAQKTRVTLKFTTVTVKEKFPPAAFLTPKFDNLKVIHD